MAAESEHESTQNRILKSTSVTGSMTLLSRISGLAREICLSRLFGAGIAMDAFVVAFRIPNLLRRFFAEGAFAQAFVPVISEYRARHAPAETQEFLDRISGTLGLALLAITAVGVAAAPLLILVFAWGSGGSEASYALATDMLRFTFPYILFISLTAFAGAILNTYRRFAVPAFTPVLLNLVLIACAIWVSPHLERPALALAFGVFAAGVVQLAFQIPFLVRLGVVPRPRWGLAHAGVRRVMRLMTPVLFGSSVAQINILFDTMIAYSFLVSGSVSWLYYADRLIEFPLGVFGIALATVILPSLSENHANASADVFSRTLDWALRWVLVVGAPAALGLALLAEPVLVTIFYGGEFTAADVDMAAAALGAFAPGLLGFILVKVLSPGYFARQDTRTPVRIAVYALLLNMALNVAFVYTLLRTGWFPPHAGLAAATTTSALFNAALLLAGLRRAGVYRFEAGWLRLLAQVVLACAAMAAFIFWARGFTGDWYAAATGLRVVMLAGVIGAAALVYLGAGLLVGVRPATLRGR